MDTVTIAWPVAELDPVARLRALAAALPHVSLEEGVIEAPLAQVWGVAGDLEYGVPRFEPSVERVLILDRTDERIELVAHGSLGTRVRMQAILRPGWCVMRSRIGDIGMAATPEGASATRFAHFEGSSLLGRGARPWFRRRVRGDLGRLAAVVGARLIYPAPVRPS